MRLYGFGVAIVVFSIFGVIINIGSIILLFLKKKPSHFHQLLKVLSFFDLLVVICCAISYGFPDLMPGYMEHEHPTVVAWVLPISHIAVMTSIYCTVLISFERYVRICFFCQLRTTRLITPENFKYYIIALIAVPVLFYIPKFFEVKAEVFQITYDQPFNCSRIQIFDKSPVILNLFKDKMFENRTREEGRRYLVELVRLGMLCGKDTSMFHDLSGPDMVHKTFGPTEPQTMDETNMINMTNYKDVMRVVETELRRNPVYYKLYYVYLNTLVCTIIPLVSLLYLNTITVITLRKIMAQELEESPPQFVLRKSVSTDHFEALIEKPLLSMPEKRRSSSTITRSLSADIICQVLDESPTDCHDEFYMRNCNNRNRREKGESFEMQCTTSFSENHRKLLLRENLAAEEIITKKERIYSNPMILEQVQRFSNADVLSNRRKSLMATMANGTEPFLPNVTGCTR